MKARIFVFTAALVGVVLAVFAWMRFSDPNAIQAESPVAVAAEAVPSSPEDSSERDNRSSGNVAVSVATPSESLEGEGSKPFQSPQTRLLELSSRNDPDSLREILTEMTSQDPAIRQAALEAARQFGSRDAIPFLTEVADRTDDPREKVRILDAIDSLKIPSLTELRATAAGGSPEGQ